MPDAPDSPDALREHLALALVPGLGPKLTAALLARFGSPSAARRATAAELLTVPHIGEKLAAQLAAALRAADARGELELLARHGARAVPLGFAEYPAPLAAVPAPPPLLYFRGTYTAADAKAVGIVGTRTPTAYGKRVAEALARDLARAGFTVVSGLARGIDGVAHRAALDAGGRTIACLAGGLSGIYPPEHKELADDVARSGCLVSETPMGMSPQPGMFPARNRVISGLSRGIIVVEADIKSGALITATHAAEQGREVFAVPGPTDSRTSAGCLDLIRKGARLVRGAADVIEDLKGIAVPEFGPAKARAKTVTLFDDVAEAGAPEPPPEPEPPAPQLEGAQARVYEALASKRHADELVRELGLAAGEVSRTLMQLELKKLVRRLPGNYYERR
jgi:DNA processing protein